MTMPSVTNNKSKAFILYLFGFFLFSASPVFADEYQDGLQACKQLQWDGAKGSKNIKKNCFRDLAIATYNAGIEETAQLERQLVELETRAADLETQLAEVIAEADASALKAAETIAFHVGTVNQMDSVCNERITEKFESGLQICTWPK